MHVPQEPVHTWFCGNRLRRPNPVARNSQALRMRIDRLISARIFSDQLILAVFDLNRDRTTCIFRKEIIDHRAVWRIFAGRFVRRQRRVGVQVRANAQRGLGFKQQIFALVPVELPQRSNVIEDPKAATMRGHDEIVVLDDKIAHRARR